MVGASCCGNGDVDECPNGDCCGEAGCCCCRVGFVVGVLPEGLEVECCIVMFGSESEYGLYGL